MSGKVNKLLRKTAKVMDIPIGKLKNAHRKKNHIERTEIYRGLRKGLNVKSLP